MLKCAVNSTSCVCPQVILKMKKIGKKTKMLNQHCNADSKSDLLKHLKLKVLVKTAVTIQIHFNATSTYSWPLQSENHFPFESFLIL